MHLQLILIFGFSLILGTGNAADASDLSEVNLSRVSYSGTGCSAGSVSGSLSREKDSFTLTFDLYRIEISPTAPVTAVRKNCLIHVDIDHPVGIQYLISSTTFAGSATLEKGVTLSEQANYYYPDSKFPHITSANKNVLMYVGDLMTSTIATIEGPKTGAFEITSEDLYRDSNTLWSPCGRAVDLNIYLKVFLKSTVANSTGLFPSDLPEGLLGQFTLTTGILWRTCL